MNNLITKVAGITIIAGLSIGMAGCSGNNENNPPGEDFVGVTEAPVIRAEAGMIQNFTSEQTINDEKKYTQNNALMLSEDGNAFEITGSGTMDKITNPVNDEEQLPAEGEKFYVINYLFSGVSSQTSYSGETTGDKVSVNVDGKKIELEQPLSPEGALLISAPDKAEIIIDIQSNGITQSIDMMTAERTTEGVADVWYAETAGTVSEPSVNEPVVVGKNTVTLAYTVNDAFRTAYMDKAGMGWADNGRKAWVVLDMTKAKWTVNGADPTNKKDIAYLVDSKGNKYAPVSAMGSYDDEGQVVFLAPADETSFTLHTENYADITYFGDIVGNTGNIIKDQVKINFMEAK